MSNPDFDRRMAARLAARDEKQQLRRLRGFRHEAGMLVDAAGRRLLDFSSNDYLGLAQHPELRARSIAWTERLGAGSRASRLVTGTCQPFLDVEARLAQFKRAEAALVFASGFQANATVLPAIIALLEEEGEPTVFCDRLNHASLHHGVAAAGRRQTRYRHNDLGHLADLLAAAANRPGPKLIVTESVFSMDGDRADVPALVELAERFGAIVYLDEAHATGVLGPQGRGLSALVPGRVDIVMGTLGKALGGAGAYIAGSRVLIDYLVNFCAGFVYSTAPMPAQFGALDAALDLVPDMDVARAALLANSARLREALQRHRLQPLGDTQIVPALTGSDAAALEAQNQLEAVGVLAIAIRPPTVPKGQARLRFTLSAANDEAALTQLIDAIAMLELPA